MVSTRAIHIVPEVVSANQFSINENSSVCSLHSLLSHFSAAKLT